MDEVKRYSWHEKVSIKQAFTITIAAVCLMIAICSLLVVFIVNEQKKIIHDRYDAYFTFLGDDNFSEYQTKEIPGFDGLIYNETTMIIVVLIIFIVIAAAIWGGRFYYNWKLQKPLEILADASDHSK